MKHLTLPFIVGIFFFLSTQAQPYLKPGMITVQGEKPTLHDLQRAFYDYWDARQPDLLHEQENAEEGGYQQFKRWEAFMQQRTFPTGEFPKPDILFTEYQKLKNQFASAKGNGSNQTQTANWNFLGPHVVPGNGGGAGRINCMTFDPVDPNVLWIGAACGGLWKSVNGGSSWTSNTDLLPSLSISEIVINPSDPNIMYAATGDKYGIYYQYEVWGHYSAGVMKSTDGGLTWNQSGLNYNQWNGEIIQRLIMDNSNPDVLYAATFSGIYKTTNGGTTWTNLRPGSYYDIEFKPGTPSIMYVADSLGALRSTDAGVSWTRISSITGAGRTSIAVTPANPDVVYVWSVSGGFYYSNNSGVSFTPRSDPSSQAGPYGHYDYVLTVSPVNENVLFTGGLNVAKSTNGGTSWITSSDWSGWPGSNYCHADNHDLEFANGSSQIIYSCNDGGIFKSIDQGATWTDLSGGLDIKQYYRFSSSQQNPNIMYGGAQDNGSDRISGLNTAIQVNGADGEDCLVDWSNDNIAFVSSQGGYFYKTTDGGNTFNYVSTVSGSDWTSPIVMDPNNHNVIYVGSTTLEKSTDNGNNWNPMSVSFNGAVYSIRVAPSNSNYIYAASFGQIKKTTNGSTFNDITGNLPVEHAAITGIAIDPDDPNRVWVCFSGYSENNKVYQSDDGGTTWINISGRLPNIPVNCIEYQKNSEDILYIGTDLGIFYAAGSLNEWLPYNTGLPNVIVYDLDTHYPTGKLRTATFGRGIWESDTQTVSHPTLDAGTSGIISPLGETCDTSLIPVVRIRNIGTTTLTSVNIHYHVDNDPDQVYAWTGNLAHLASADVTLPAFIVSGGLHTFYSSTSDPNGSADMHIGNDSAFSTINVLSNQVGIQAPFAEGFVSPVFPPPTWTLENSENLWSRSTAAGGFGLSNESARANFWSIQTGEDKIMSSNIDFGNLIAPITLTFDIAYSPYNGYQDSLIVDLSSDCNGGGIRIYAKGGASLGTTAASTSQFTPNSSQWRTETVNLDQYAGQNSMELRFIAKTAYGNDLFLDNINLDAYNVGVHEIIPASGDHVSVFPNPSAALLNVEAVSAKSNSLNITITDMFGKTVREMNDASFRISKRYSFDLSDLASGIYFVKTSSEVLNSTYKIQVAK